MNIEKLISRGRVVEVTKTGEHGELLLVGYQRKGSSRKHYQRWMLRQPKVLKPAPDAQQAPQTAPAEGHDQPAQAQRVLPDHP